MVDNKELEHLDKNKNLMQNLNALSHESAIGILVELCSDNDLYERIITMVKMILSKADADSIAADVFNCLNSIQVEDLWENSGKTRYGYSDPIEVAYEMLDDQVSVFILKMNQYRDLGMHKQEKEYCKGILTGVLMYGNEGNNEFRDWAPDDPYTIADNIINDWKENHSADDIVEIQALYDSFFSDETNDINIQEK